MGILRLGMGHESLCHDWVGMSVSNRNTLRVALFCLGLGVTVLADPSQTGFILIVRHDGPTRRSEPLFKFT